jgi:arylsulfatase A-like enzyme
MPPASLSPSDVENVLFVCTDQQRQDSLAPYGNDWVDTPNADALAGAGTRFDRAYTPSAICSPARVSLLTGVRPHAHGGERNVGADESFADDNPTYPERLHGAGFAAAHSGKWHVGQDPAAFGLDGPWLTGWHQPFDHPDYRAYLDERDLPPLTAERLRDPIPEGGERYQSGAVDDRPLDANFTRYVTERAITQLETNAAADGPFYQSVHYYGPHNPYYLPAEYFHRYDPSDVPLYESGVRETFDLKPWTHGVQRRQSGLRDLPIAAWREIVAAYHGWVTFIDHELGRLVDALDRLGVADETAVVFASDHGAFLTAHAMHDKGPAMYEDIYRVPLIATGIGGDGTGDDRLVSLLDVAPTVCDWAGVPVPDAYAGRSLVREAGDGRSPAWRDAVRAEFHGHKFAYEQRMLVTDRYKLVLNAYDVPELYDLDSDPHELDNLIDDPEYGDVAARLHDRLLSDLRADGDPFVDGHPMMLTNASDVGIDGFDADA